MPTCGYRSAIDVVQLAIWRPFTIIQRVRFSNSFFAQQDHRIDGESAPGGIHAATRPTQSIVRTTPPRMTGSFGVA